MLTREAFENRRWAGFPLLRRALEDKPPPKSPEDLLTSVDETDTGAILRLLGVARLAAACPGDVWDAARRGGSDAERAVHHEIAELATELRAAMHRMSAKVEKSLRDCQRLHAIVEQPVRPAEPEDDR